MDELNVSEVGEVMTPAAVKVPSAEEPALPAERGEDAQVQQNVGILAIPIDLELVLATVRMSVSRLMDLAPGAEIDLDSLSSGEVKLHANGALFAIGELFLIDAAEKRVGLRIKRLAGAAP